MIAPSHRLVEFSFVDERALLLRALSMTRVTTDEEQKVFLRFMSKTTHDMVLLKIDLIEVSV